MIYSNFLFTNISCLKHCFTVTRFRLIVSLMVSFQLVTFTIDYKSVTTSNFPSRCSATCKQGKKMLFMCDRHPPAQWWNFSDIPPDRTSFSSPCNAMHLLNEQPFRLILSRQGEIFVCSCFFYLQAKRILRVLYGQFVPDLVWTVFYIKHWSHKETTVYDCKLQKELRLYLLLLEGN